MSTNNAPFTLDKLNANSINTGNNLVLTGGIRENTTLVGGVIKTQPTNMLPNNKNSIVYGVSKPGINTPIEDVPIITQPSGKTVNNIKNALKNINWSRSYKWDVDFVGAPSPFNSYEDNSKVFPAVNVDDAIAVGNIYSFDAGISSYCFPKNKTYFDIRITFLDDEIGTLEQWFEQWFFNIYTPRGVNYLSNSAKELHIKKLTSDDRVVFTRKYLVFPSGTLYGVNTSESHVRMFSVDLCVCAYLKKSV